MRNRFDPLGNGGWLWCHCLYHGGFCWGGSAMSPADRERLEREALDVVAAGRVLPADGLFFVGFNAGERVVRWKCDGKLAGRVAMVETSISTGTQVGSILGR